MEFYSWLQRRFTGFRYPLFIIFFYNKERESKRSNNLKEEATNIVIRKDLPTRGINYSYDCVFSFQKSRAEIIIISAAKNELTRIFFECRILKGKSIPWVFKTSYSFNIIESILKIKVSQVFFEVQIE